MYLLTELKQLDGLKDCTFRKQNCQANDTITNVKKWIVACATFVDKNTYRVQGRFTVNLHEYENQFLKTSEWE